MQEHFENSLAELSKAIKEFRAKHGEFTRNEYEADLYDISSTLNEFIKMAKTGEI